MKDFGASCHKNEGIGQPSHALVCRCMCRKGADVKPYGNDTCERGATSSKRGAGSNMQSGVGLSFIGGEEFSIE